MATGMIEWCRLSLGQNKDGMMYGYNRACWPCSGNITHFYGHSHRCCMQRLYVLLKITLIISSCCDGNNIIESPQYIFMSATTYAYLARPSNLQSFQSRDNSKWGVYKDYFEALATSGCHINSSHYVFLFTQTSAPPAENHNFFIQHRKRHEMR